MLSSRKRQEDKGRRDDRQETRLVTIDPKVITAYQVAPLTTLSGLILQSLGTDPMTAIAAAGDIIRSRNAKAFLACCYMFTTIRGQLTGLGMAKALGLDTVNPSVIITGRADVPDDINASAVRMIGSVLWSLGYLSTQKAASELCTAVLNKMGDSWSVMGTPEFPNTQRGRLAEELYSSITPDHKRALQETGRAFETQIRLGFRMILEKAAIFMQHSSEPQTLSTTEVSDEDFFQASKRKGGKGSGRAKAEEEEAESGGDEEVEVPVVTSPKGSAKKGR